MRAQEKQRLIFSAVIAAVLHIVVFFLRFVVDFSSPEDDEYLGPVTISFAQEIVEEDTPPARETTPQEEAASSQDQEVPDNPVAPDDPAKPENSALIETGGDNSSQESSEENSTQNLPEENLDDPFTGGREENPSSQDVSDPTEAQETGEDANQATPGRRFVETTQDSNPQDEENVPEEPAEDTNSLDLGDLGDLFSPNTDDPTDTPNTPSPSISEENPYGFSGEIRTLSTLSTQDPVFNFDIEEGLLAFRIEVQSNGSVIYKGIDLNASSPVFSNLYSKAQLEGPMRAALQNWRFSEPPKGKVITALGYIRITK